MPRIADHPRASVARTLELAAAVEELGGGPPLEEGGEPELGGGGEPELAGGGEVEPGGPGDDICRLLTTIGQNSGGGH